MPKKDTQPIDYSKPLANEQRELFCQEYMKDCNATKAAKRAKYSEKTAHSQGPRLLEFVDVKNRLEYLREQLVKSTGVTPEMLMAELKKVGFSNIEDFLSIDESGDVIGKSFDSIPRETLAAVESVKQTVNVTHNKDGSREYETKTFDFKLHSKLAAIRDMAKHIGFFEKDNEQKKNNLTAFLIANRHE
jgi:phage terminase small subunit